MYSDKNIEEPEPVQEIMNAVKAFRQEWEESEAEQPDYKRLIEIMEPLYKAGGYREKLGTGEQEILILSDGAAGDFICASPAIRTIRNIYPKAKITLFRYGTSGLDLAKHCPYADKIIIEKSTYGDCDIKAYFDWCIKISEKLLAHHFELAFCFSKVGTSQLLAYLAGVRNRICYKCGGNFGGRRKMFKGNEPSDYFQTVNIPDKYSTDAGRAQLARKSIGMLDFMLQAPVRDRKLEVWFTPEELSSVRKKIHFSMKENVCESFRYVAVNLSASTPKRHYPPEKYVEFFFKLLEKDKQLRFLIIGGPSERYEADVLMESIGSEYACNLVGRLTYCETSAAVSLCQLFIGNDSAPLHIAIALRLPVLLPVCYPAIMQKKASNLCSIIPPNGIMVQVLPLRPLPECKHSRDWWGCGSSESHCIRQIESDTLVKAYEYLQKIVESGAETKAFVTSVSGNCLVWTEITDNLKHIVDLFYRAYLRISFQGCIGSITDMGNESMLSVPQWETAYITDDTGTVELRILFNGDGQLQLVCEAAPNEFNFSGIPCIVRYTSIVVDGKEILSDPVDASVDAPLSLAISGRLWQEVSVRIKWNAFPYDKSLLECVVEERMPKGSHLL